MVIINKDTDIKTRNKKYVTVREQITYTEEEYEALRRGIFVRARKARQEKYNRLSKIRREKFLMIQYHQKLMLEAPNQREFDRLEEVTKYMQWELRDLDQELAELSKKL